MLSANSAPMPYLQRQGTATLLMVDDKPFFIRGGELGNSSFEREYLAPYWPMLKELGLNTVLAPVSWELIEPSEGQFNFNSVAELLADARANDMRLVLLWFGSWKNSMSCYAPNWVKRNPARFPRAAAASGEVLEILSPFSDANAQADATAFAALMVHLREVDPQHTVIMVQVENEIGMIPDARDHSQAAQAAWAGPVPAALIAYLKTHPLQPHIYNSLQNKKELTGGTWAQVFGNSPKAQEIFQAWYFAQYAEKVASAGRAQLDLPMYTNAALIRPGTEPGQYPSAGPLPHLADIWRAAAPSLDFIAPDIYFPNFAHWADAYVASGNPLFVPEALRSLDAAANALYAFGQYSAIGFCSFGIESIEPDAAEMLTGAYNVIGQLTPLIAAHAGSEKMVGLLPPADDMRHPLRVRFGEYLIAATFERVPAPSLADGVINESGQAAGAKVLPAAAILISIGDDQFVFAGIGVTLSFQPHDGVGKVGILHCEEGRFDPDWHRIRTLNGDQTHQGRHIRLEPGKFAIQQFALYRY